MPSNKTLHFHNVVMFLSSESLNIRSPNKIVLKDPCGTMLYKNSIDDLLFLLFPLVSPSFPTLWALCLLQDQCMASMLWAQGSQHLASHWRST